ncbi:hypothetical protein A8135_13795 [Legionella jamestowniensis]|uniref:Polysaccharide biosynthesis protein n=2 Tax=Legionella jamestowniensis TaxID=455 RepID=A0ABX2XSG5_9GAMM|nr:hypothetical protein A8135_13795 [Legionella jamestowniensis]
MVFLGAIGFPASIYLSRVCFANKGLVSLIYLQTSTSFLAFLIQAGIRAGLRKEFLVGHLRIVNEVESYIKKTWVYIFPPLSVLSLFLMQGYFLPTISALNAILTLLIGLRLVQGRIKAAGFFSSILFLMNFSAGFFCLYFGNDRLAIGIVVEFFAFIIGIIFIYQNLPHINYRRGFNSLIKVLKKYVGLQISSFLIVFCSYIFAQIILRVSQTDKEIIILYSDAIIISGIMTMFLSRLMLIFEQKLVKSGRVESYLWLMHLSLLLTTLCASLIRGGEYYEKMLFFLILLGLLGRYSSALVSSFIQENMRGIFLRMTNAVVIFQVIMLLLNLCRIWYSSWIYFAAFINLFTLSVILLIIYSGKGIAYIVDVSRRNENY